MKQVLLAALLVITGVAVYAQTPDGETPANEGVCDDLMFATPGLYGLCVAYCEAMDCDFSVEGEPPCGKAGPKILRNYNRKMQPGDPEMPCLLPPPAECPCFSLEEALAIPHRMYWTENELVCYEEPEPSSGDWGRAEGIILYQGDESPYAGAGSLSLVNYGYCWYFESAQNIQRYKLLTEPDAGHLEEAWACFDIIWQACLARGDCYFREEGGCPNYPVP